MHNGCDTRRIFWSVTGGFCCHLGSSGCDANDLTHGVIFWSCTLRESAKELRLDSFSLGI